jgi:hypothetical protein
MRPWVRCRSFTGLISSRTVFHRVLQFTSLYGIQGVECAIVHRWMGSTMYLVGGHGILVFYFGGFGYCLRTSNFLAGNCNVPTLGHHHRAEIYDDQSSQMDARASTGVFERHCGVHLALMIIFHHYEPFRTGWLWFRCIPTISMILTILSYKSMEFTEEVILGTLLGGTSQCNSSLESGGATL